MTTVQVVKVMNEGDIRRKALLDLLKTGDGPVSGSTLSGKLGVSRPGDRSGYCAAESGK